jgi:hypothetical protein
MSATYNGWTNHATWCVNLWMTSNDEATYKEWRRIARSVYRKSHATATLTLRQSAEYEFSRILKDKHSEDNPLEPTGVYSDLLSSALDSVNWDEISRAFIEAECPVEDEDDESEE